MNVIPSVNVVLSSNSKDQLRGFHNYLNQKVITPINTLDGYTLENNLITIHQVNYMSSALIQAEAGQNNQEYLEGNKVDSITSLI